MVAQPRLTTQDRIWQAEDDARTLARAEEIRKDAKRLNLAKAQANKMIKDQENSLKAIKKIKSIKAQK